MDLLRLRYFIAVAEELNFRRAAERLDLAQPPLSRHVAQLEKEVGALLFDRSHSQIRLTQAGVLLLERARNLLAQADGLLHDVRRIGSGREGLLRIAFVGSATHGFLPSLIKAYRTEFPNVDLDLSAMNNAGLARALILRDIDAAIARPSITDKEVRSETLHREPLILAVPEGSPASGLARPRLADLQREMFILYPAHPRPSFADHIIAVCREAGIHDPATVMAMDYQTAISLVSVGVGVSIVPDSVSTSPRAGVQYRTYEGPNPGTQLSVNYRLDNRSPQLRGFLDIARRFVRTGVG